MKFIVDSNVGRLARWLRIAGFDTVFINDLDDNRLVRLALSEGRVLLTKDTQILKRRVATTGRLKVILIESEEVKAQLRQVVKNAETGGGDKTVHALSGVQSTPGAQGQGRG